jgi:transcriptional regulator GlxA family with amidase domain
VADLDPHGIDTLVAVGGNSVDQAAQNSALTGWIAAAGASARRVTSVCSGVFGFVDL